MNREEAVPANKLTDYLCAMVQYTQGEWAGNRQKGEEIE